MSKPFSPQVLGEEEIASLLSQVSDEEVAQARQFSLTPPSTVANRAAPSCTTMRATLTLTALPRRGP